MGVTFLDICFNRIIEEDKTNKYHQIPILHRKHSFDNHLQVMQESAKDNAFISSTYEEENAFCKNCLICFP